ncbi:19485_t:CDS:2, partial [Gigaspora margarita]
PQSQKKSQSGGSGRHACFSEEKAQLYEWVMSVRQDGLAIIYLNLKVKMAEISYKSTKQTQNITKRAVISNFKFSTLWLTVDLKENLLNFQQFVIHLRQKNEYLLKMIANMNETLVWFDMAGSLTINPKEFRNSKMMLVLDSFAAHITDKAKTAFRSENTDLAVIPGGLTSMCQPLDVCINKLFKDKLHSYWHKWMADSGNGLTKSKNLRRADLSTVCHWILNAWNDISNEIIVWVFKKCSNSNLEFDDNKKSDENEESYENESSNQFNNWPECYVVIS